jgi:hypothetical protein
MDPTYITIFVNGTNATKVFSMAATLLYNGLGLLSVLVLFAVTGIILVIIDITSRLREEKNYENRNQTQKTTSTQQLDNRNVFIDYKALDIIKGSFAFGITLAVLIVLMSIMAIAFAINTLGYQMALAIIIGFAAPSIIILSDGYHQVNKLMPKRIKKVVKVTTIYEDGTTIKKERKYKY